MRIEKNSKLIIIAVSLFILLNLKGTAVADENLITLDTITQQAQQMHLLLNQRKAAGFDVSKAEELDRLSKNAAEKGDYDASLRLINEVKSLLEKMKDLPKKQVEGTLAQQAQHMHLLLEQKKKEGFNVSEVEDLDRLSREAAEKGNYEESLRFINKAISLLKKMKDLPLKEVTVELPVNTKRVYITPSVPGLISGKDIKKYEKAFTSQTVDVKNGNILLKLSNIPIFVEEPQETKENIVYNKEVSPFGVHEPPFDNYDARLDDLGIRWVRLSGPSGVVWDADEPKKGKYNWSRVDSSISLFYKHNINMVVTILCFNKWDQGIGMLKEPGIPVKKLPKHLMGYQSFLKRVVERFDGDGIEDAPGSPIVKYWQIENEPDGIEWKDTPKNFATLVKVSHKAIKESNPSAKIVLAGMTTPEGYYKFYAPMLDELEKMKEKPDEKIFDIVDIHWTVDSGGDYRSIRGHKMEVLIANLNNKLNSLGYKDVPIWITEMSSYSGKPMTPPSGIIYKEKSEAEHAADLIKSYIYPLSLGIKKIFWTFGLVEHHNWGGLGVYNYWDTISLIHNPMNSGQSHKKLAYYSYKLMVDKLADSGDITTLNLGKGIYAYKFLKGNKPVYILWYEGN